MKRKKGFGDAGEKGAECWNGQLRDSRTRVSPSRSGQPWTGSSPGGRTPGFRSTGMGMCPRMCPGSSQRAADFLATEMRQATCWE